MPFWSAVWDNIKDNLAKYIGAGVVALLAVGGPWVWHVLVVPIDVSSMDPWSPPNATQFFSGQKLRFSLEGVDSERVIWVFDEDRNQSARSVVVTTTPYVDYSFESDPNDKQSGSNRRVDAFFKSGAGYRSAWRLVAVTNAKVQADVQLKPTVQGALPPRGGMSSLQLMVGSQLPGDWVLDSARLGTLGKSGVQENPKLALTPIDPSHTVWNFPVSADFPATKNAWVSLDFKSPSSNRTLQLIKPLPDLESKIAQANQIKD